MRFGCQRFPNPGAQVRFLPGARWRVKMARQQSLHERIAERRPLIELLISDFGGFVDAFDENRQFSGPSLYFHVKALTITIAHHDYSIEVGLLVADGGDEPFDLVARSAMPWSNRPTRPRCRGCGTRPTPCHRCRKSKNPGCGWPE